MALVLRTDKGSPLTWQEGDDNLTYLSNSIQAAVDVPGGSDGQVQYNDNGNFNGVPDLTYSGGALSATGSFLGSLDGTAAIATYVENAQTASYIQLSGFGIEVNNLELTASVRSVNGVFPSNGNIETALTATVTGTSASFDTSGSGDITGSLPDGLVWIISNDPTPSWNGDVYIYSSGSVGAWYPVAPLDTAAGDARYLKLDGANSPLQGNLDFGGYDITNSSTISATTLNGDLTSTYVAGPLGYNTILTASYATTASYVLQAKSALTASYINQLSQDVQIQLARPNGFIKMASGNSQEPAMYLQTPYGNSMFASNLKYESGAWKYTCPGPGSAGQAGSMMLLEPTVGQFLFYTSPVSTSGSTATITERFRVASTGVTVGFGGTTNFTVTGSTILSGQVTLTLGNYGDDAAAALGGVPVGGLYRNGNVVSIRLS